MSCERETAAVLRDAGRKVTLQRMAVLCTLRHARRHLTAPELLEDVRQDYAYIDASTIYRTLSSARELRLVSETKLGSGEDRFEWVGKERHHHLVCRVCDRVTSLDNSYLDGLATALLEDAGFAADLDHFAITGVCRDCAGQPAPAEGETAEDTHV